MSPSLPAPRTTDETPGDTLAVRRLGRRDYAVVWHAMRRFTAARTPHTPDELWLVEHPPVYTLGRNGRMEHLVAPGGVPVVRSDRGGQVTYHGPGQLIVYCLLDLARRSLGVRALVSVLEDSVIHVLACRGLAAASRRDAPGVYVAGSKIAAVGLRVARGRSYHGMSLNVSMDLEPFTRIHPCGYPGLSVTQLRDEGIDWRVPEAAAVLTKEIAGRLGYVRLLQDPPRVRAVTDSDGNPDTGEDRHG